MPYDGMMFGRMSQRRVERKVGRPKRDRSKNKAQRQGRKRSR